MGIHHGVQLFVQLSVGIHGSFYAFYSWNVCFHRLKNNKSLIYIQDVCRKVRINEV